MVQNKHTKTTVYTQRKQSLAYVLGRQRRANAGTGGEVTGDGIDAFISYNEEPSLRLRTDDNLTDVIEVVQTNDKVVVQRKDNARVRNATLQAYFELPELNTLELTGGSIAISLLAFCKFCFLCPYLSTSLEVSIVYDK